MPKPDPLYVLEKLGEAVYELATGAGRIQERLYQAAIFIHRIRPEDFVDEEMRRVFTEIKNDLTFDEPQGSEGRLIGTLRKNQRCGCLRYRSPHFRSLPAAPATNLRLINCRM
jgi:hypothetical protein